MFIKICISCKQMTASQQFILKYTPLQMSSNFNQSESEAEAEAGSEIASQCNAQKQKKFHAYHQQQQFESQISQISCISRKRYSAQQRFIDQAIKQTCQQYQCAWSIIATALFKEHKIDKSQDYIRNRYMNYLRDQTNSDPIEWRQAKGVMRLYLVQTKSFIQISKVLNGKRQKDTIKRCVDRFMRVGFNKIQKHNGFIVTRSDQKFKKGYCRKGILIHHFKRYNEVIRNPINKYFLRMLHIFIFRSAQELDKHVPKEVSGLMLQFMEQIIDTVIEQWEQRIKDDPKTKKPVYLVSRLKAETILKRQRKQLRLAKAEKNRIKREQRKKLKQQNQGKTCTKSMPSIEEEEKGIFDDVDLDELISEHYQ